ncbi:alpha/beta fold hydrolase [Candidatus Poriferisodalis sp.]|uniref:alpha/beta fold hydrolase n=1 Tax=Candidatus Poriferisodalis sp. TaxID=3101277 RepID=UPI003B5258FB
MLLTHGNSLNAGMWATVVPHLQDGFHCWGLDFRGHGSARPQHDDMSVERSHFVDEVLAATDALGGGRLLAAGHSLDASSLVLAELAQPGTYQGLWLYEPLLAPPGASRPDIDHPLAQPIAEVLGNGRLKTFTELGHFGPMENGEAIAQDIRVHLEPLIAA